MGDHSIDFDDFAQPICLGDRNPQQGDMCIVAAWMDTEHQGVSFHQYLEHIPVPHVEREECDSPAHYNGHLAPTDICTGARADRTTCRDDTGAPLMCLDSEGAWKLVGILSREGECLTRSHPDVFTSAIDLNGWISKTIGRS